MEDTKTALVVEGIVGCELGRRDSQRGQRGSGLVEFAVLVALVALASIASVKALGSRISQSLMVAEA